MSALAYWDAELIQKQLRQWGYSLVAPITDAASDTSAYLAARDKVPAVWAEGKIHHLWVTGHSLGAALAQLASLRLTKFGHSVRAVYTFGTPRVGDSAFVADYDELLGNCTFPHVNDQDVVTRVPPFLLGFRAVASRQTRRFTGIGHQMAPFEEMAAQAETAGDWRNAAIDSIRQTTDFLPAFLRPRALQSTLPAAPPSLYSATFKQGGLDEHGSFEYLFKLVCEALEQDLWPMETRQANTRTF